MSRSAHHSTGRREPPIGGCVLELYILYYYTQRCLWLLESDCTQLCKYIHIVVKCGPRQYEKERCELRHRRSALAFPAPELLRRLGRSSILLRSCASARGFPDNSTNPLSCIEPPASGFGGTPRRTLPRGASPARFRGSAHREGAGARNLMRQWSGLAADLIGKRRGGD